MSALACVRVRFQRHDVLPYAFCFNFLEATSSISFPLLLFFFPSFFTLFGPPSRSCVPLSPVAASATALPRPSWELREMYHGGFQHCGCCARYISSPSPIPPYPHSLTAFLHPPTPSPSSPPRPDSLFSLLPVYPFPTTLSLSLTPPPLRRSKGLNRPVQFPTRSASNPRCVSRRSRVNLRRLRRVRRRDVALRTFFFLSDSLSGRVESDRLSMFFFMFLSSSSTTTTTKTTSCSVTVSMKATE